MDQPEDVNQSNRSDDATPTDPHRGYPRRRFLGQLGAVGVAGAVGAAASAAPALSAAAEAATGSPIQHIIVCCQENHSFDNYFGSLAGLPSGYGIPPGYSNVDGNGNTVTPFHFPNLTGNGVDPAHDWTSTHTEYDGGRMDGFALADGSDALGYYEAADLPYYYSLLSSSTLCANYFCGVLGPTFPNRLVLYSGTSGGNTSNSISRGSLTYPCVLDLLKAHNVTFKNYNFHCSSNSSILALFKNWSSGGANNQLNQSMSQFFTDCTAGSLAQVTFISEASPYDEHPAANIQTGMNMIKSIVQAVQASPAWASTAILITWDEGGGYFDHVAPRQLDAFGPGVRVPMLVVSPYAKAGHVDTTFSDHSSVLKFIEHVFALPTLASINHAFDSATPKTNNATGGAAFPPRDGNSALSDLTQCFNGV